MTTQPSRTTERGQAATDLLRLLYPAPLTVTPGSAGGRCAVTSWLAVPTAHNPRLLVTAGSTRAAVTTLRRQLTGQRARTRAARAVLSAAVGSGLPMRTSRLMMSVTGPQNAPSIHDPLCEALGVGEVCVSLPIGPARANRKPVLQITDPRGQVLAFVKVGHDELTRGLVGHEAAVLQRIAQSPHFEVRAPRALAHLAWRDLSVLILEPLDIPSTRLGGAMGRARLLAVIREIARLGGGSETSWSGHPHRRGLMDGLHHCGHHAPRVRRQLALLDDTARVTVSAWHGDFNPGNVAIVEGPCPVWDWERFSAGLPLGYDLLHHDLHHMITVQQRDAGEAADTLLTAAPGLLQPLGVHEDAADATARSYLITLAQRYFADRQDDIKAHLDRVEDWLLPALEKHSRRSLEC